MVKNISVSLPSIVDLNQYFIKIPVYVSEFKFESEGMFGGVTYKHMIQGLIKKIDEYNGNSGEIKNYKKKKTFERRVKGITYQEIKIGDSSTLLLKMTAYNTNYLDGFYEKGDKVPLTKEAKIGSDNNFMLMYPNISGLDPNNYKYQWVILLYEDPNKDFNEIASTAKAVLNKVLDIKVKNVKLNTVINDITIKEIAPEIIVKMITVDYDSDNESPEFKEYLIVSVLDTEEN